MKYLLKYRKLQKKYEDEIKDILADGKYNIRKIESFAEFSDQLAPFRECSMLLKTAVTPISFSECELAGKQLGIGVLVDYRTRYVNAKYKWTKRCCRHEDITLDEHLDMLQRIQNSTLPFGAYTIAFKCHRLNEKTVKSHYSGKRIVYAPLLYDIVDVKENVLDFFCHRLAEKLYDSSSNDFHQMNVYTDNIMTSKDVDDMYPLIKKLAQKYNEYATTMYHMYKDSEIYRHREDFPQVHDGIFG